MSRRRKIPEKVWRVKRPEVKSSIEPRVEVPLSILGAISVYLDETSFNTIQNYIIGMDRSLDSYEADKEIFDKMHNERAFVLNFTEDCLKYYKFYSIEKVRNFDLLPTVLHNISPEEAPDLIVLSLNKLIYDREIFVILDLIKFGEMKLTKNLAKKFLEHFIHIQYEKLVTNKLYNKIFELDWDYQELYDIYKSIGINRIVNLNYSLMEHSKLENICKLTQMVVQYENEFLEDYVLEMKKYPIESGERSNILEFYIQLCEILSRYQQCLDPYDYTIIRNSTIATVSGLLEDAKDLDLINLEYTAKLYHELTESLFFIL